MKPVTQAEFFAVINPLDVHPRVDVGSLKDRWHSSQWEIQSTRRVVGMSKSDSWASQPTEYYIAQSDE